MSLSSLNAVEGLHSALPLFTLPFIKNNVYDSMTSFLGVNPWYLKELCFLFTSALQKLTIIHPQWTELDLMNVYLLRLRLNLPYRVISCLTAASPSTVWRIEENTTNIIGAVAMKMLKFPGS